MTKRLLALILALIMCLSFVGCGKDSSDNKDNKETSLSTSDEIRNDDKDKKDDKNQKKESSVSPILYKVTDDDGNVAWLFGSIHIGRDDYYPLPDYVMDAYDSSDALAVEFDINAFEKDTKAQMEALTSLVYIDGTKIDEHISKELYDKAVEILEDHGMYSSMFDYYYPSFWASLIDNCMLMDLSVDMNSGVDKHLLNLAAKDKKEIMDVESAEFQYGMMADYSEDLQEMLLESSVESFDDIEKSREEIDEMLDMWASGNEDEFAELLAEEPDEEMTKEEEELYEEYLNSMIVERNIAMTEFVEDVLASGKKVFVCVGAAHVVGEGAIAERLKDLGYKVERVQ